MVDGCEINDHPYAPVCVRCRRLLAELGDDLPVGWRHRSERYGEKLATPDTSVGDLIGDVDPIKVAEGRTLGDPETVHYGLVPRTNRGIFAINELPDLAERIQVSLLNVLEERDIQVRGYPLRLPLDLLLVASANPEDYTNRGRIITPLKDRFGAEIRTHYPLRLEDEIELVRQEAAARTRSCPTTCVEVVARFTRHVRESPAVDARSGVSARFAIAGAETRRRLGAAPGGADRRGAGRGPGLRPARHRRHAAGKVEFEVDEEGREVEVLAHLLRRATVETFRRQLGASDLTALIERVRRGHDRRVPASWCRAASCSSRSGRSPGSRKCWTGSAWRRAPRRRRSPRPRVEFALEGLYLNRRITKDEVPPAASSTAAAEPWPRATGTAPGTTGPTRSRRRTTSGAPSTSSATTCSPADSPRDALRELLRRGTDGLARARRHAPPGPRAAAASCATAAGSTAPSRRYAGCSTPLSGRSARRCSPTPPTTRGCARPSSTRCRGHRRARCASCPSTTGARRGARDLRADQRPAAPRGARHASSAA